MVISDNLQTLNSNFSANRKDYENDKDNENHLDNENEGNCPAKKCMFKVNNRKKVLVSLRLTLNIFHIFFSVFNVDFKYVISQGSFFHKKYQRFYFLNGLEILIFFF